MLRFDEQQEFEAWLRRCPLPSKALAYAVSRTGDDSCLTVECRWKLPGSPVTANGGELPAEVQLVCDGPPAKRARTQPPPAVLLPPARGAGSSSSADGAAARREPLAGRSGVVEERYSTVSPAAAPAASLSSDQPPTQAQPRSQSPTASTAPDAPAAPAAPVPVPGSAPAYEPEKLPTERRRVGPGPPHDAPALWCITVLGKKDINKFFESPPGQPCLLTMQKEIAMIFHHNLHVAGSAGRFTGDGTGNPEAFIFFEDQAMTKLVGAIALYGKSKLNTMFVVQDKRRKPARWGMRALEYVIGKVKDANKAKIELMCKPKSSGQNAPEAFYEKAGFTRIKNQDKGLLEHQDVHQRRCKMRLDLKSRMHGGDSAD